MEEQKDKPKKAQKLSLKEERFVNEIIEHGNGTEAIVKAGYDVANRDVAGVMAVEYLGKPKIQNAIMSRKEEFYTRLDQEVMSLLNSLVEIANSPKTPEGVRVKAITDLLDRSGHNSKKDVSIDMNLTDSTQQTKEIAKRARELLAVQLLETSLDATKEETGSKTDADT
jgi:phage terminase small subunit